MTFVCVDFGSTFTKACLVSTEGDLIATAQHPTTIGAAGNDVLDGFEACRTELAGVDAAAGRAPVYACSSAGGGLRIAVVGYEELVTARAGRQVALTSGGKVVAVSSGGLGGAGRGGDRGVSAARLAGLWEAEPDLILLVGGTDGGNAEVLLGSANALAAAGRPTPVVVAGNVDAQPEAVAALQAAGVPVSACANVLPQIGVLHPDQARVAIREAFLAHVIGGKGLSNRPRFADLVRAPTPDAVLAGLETVAVAAPHLADRGCVVVDVGGATTDVHSVVPPDEGAYLSGELAREVIAPQRVSRTVEGDLGVRWSAATTAALADGADQTEPADLAQWAEWLSTRTDAVPSSVEEAGFDADLATICVREALRRHAGRRRVAVQSDGTRAVVADGKDLRDVAVVIGSGGVLRHQPQIAADLVTEAISSGAPGGWQLPEDATVRIDTDYVLAAIGLLAGDAPQAAAGLARRLVDNPGPA